jgi:hypothetical protein
MRLEAAPSRNSDASDHVGDRAVVALQGQRAQLDGHDQGNPVWIGAHVVGRAGHACYAPSTSQAEDRCALDIRAHPETLHQARVDTRCRNAGSGDEEKMVDTAHAKAGVPKHVQYRPAARGSGGRSVQYGELGRRSPASAAIRRTPLSTGRAAAPPATVDRPRWVGAPCRPRAERAQRPTSAPRGPLRASQDSSQ